MALNHHCMDLKRFVCGSTRWNVVKVCISYTRKLVSFLFHNAMPELGSLSAAKSCLMADERCNTAVLPGKQPLKQGNSAGFLNPTGLRFVWKGCYPAEQEILFSKNRRTKLAFKIFFKKRNCCSQGSCGMGLLISVDSERARVPRKMKLVFQILLRVSSALNKAFLALSLLVWRLGSPGRVYALLH